MNTAIVSRHAHQSDLPGGRRALSALSRKLASGLKALQCARMLSVMHRLPDSHLAAAGLRRRDILEHARRSIYGDV